MEIKVGSYFYNPAKESHDEFHITLTDKDGEEIFKDKWEGLSFTQRYNKLRGMGDLLSINWAVSEGIDQSRLPWKISKGSSRKTFRESSCHPRG